ncbi:MAG: putative Ig domain-containing protein [Methylococcaceae bacterium]|nr:putative Ig domain-containing protein [Methylococcaceae bacterium]
MLRLFHCFFKQVYIIIGLYLFSISVSPAYDYSDNQPYSQLPPQGLSVSEVPLFVSIGFDDNSLSGLEDSGGTGGMTWILDFLRNKKNPAGLGNPLTFDSTPIRVSFFNTSKYQEEIVKDDPVFIKRAWNTALNDGHEVGIHTVNHLHGSQFNTAQWNTEIGGAITHLTKPFDENEQPGNSNSASGMGANLNNLYGFRTPFLEYNNETFSALVQQGLTYDTSIEEGWENTIDGTNFPWPYTLDSGSPGNQDMLERGFPNKFPISGHPGLWELGVNPVIIPPDSATSQYGINYSIREKVLANVSYFDVVSGKITGFDFNLWQLAKLNKAETLATLKYTLDLRLQNGNRAPFLFSAHSENYGSKNAALFSQISVRERQEVIEEFLQYARSKPEVRIVPYQTVINWMRNPSAIDCGNSCPVDTLPPEVTNPGNQSNELDESVELTIHASDPNDFDLVITADNLPDGLSIDSVSGLISGIATTEGTKIVTINVDNGELSTTLSFHWEITSNTFEDPWEIIDAIGDRIDNLQEHNDELSARNFKGFRYRSRRANRYFISFFLQQAARQCWNGRPRDSISSLNYVLSKLNRKMRPGSERVLLRRNILREKANLQALLGADF